MVGTLTTFMARTNALIEVDFKKTVALSTLSQLGLIVSVLGVGVPLLAYFHILTHALFKALLFMCRGRVIHLCEDKQDLRSIGGLIYALPVTSTIINLSNYALWGFPFLAGFYSKDLFIEITLRKGLEGVGYFMFF